MRRKYETEIDLFASKKDDGKENPLPKPDQDVAAKASPADETPKADHIKPALEPQEESKSTGDPAVEFTINLLGALKAKRKQHNKDNPKNKVSLPQLKKVYKNGAGGRKKDKGLWAMARVNLFLRMKAGDKIEQQPHTYELGMKVPIDMSAMWVPTDKDFSKANEDIEEFELNYKFEDVEDLYLDDPSDNHSYVEISYWNWR